MVSAQRYVSQLHSALLVVGIVTVGDNPADLRQDGRIDLMTTRMRQFDHLSTSLRAADRPAVGSPRL